MGAAAAAPMASPTVTGPEAGQSRQPFHRLGARRQHLPGAVAPFGMAQLSPDTGHYAAYSYTDTKIRGFSMVHISGVGCGLGGDLPVLPTTGAPTSTDDAAYALPFSHDTEKASPGSYEVSLSAPAGPIKAELSATARTGWQRYTFLATPDAAVLGGWCSTGVCWAGVAESAAVNRVYGGRDWWILLMTNSFGAAMSHCGYPPALDGPVLGFRGDPDLVQLVATTHRRPDARLSPSTPNRARLTAAASKEKSAAILVCPRTRARRPSCRRRIR